MKEIIREKKIGIAVDKMEWVPFSRLRILQDDLKDLTWENYEKLKAEILDREFSFAPHVWPNPNWEGETGDLGILDGTQRYRALKRMIEKEGYWIDKVPVVFVRAKTERDAVLKVLGGAGMYGTPNDEGLYALVMKHNIAPVDMKNLSIPGIETPKFLAGYFGHSPDFIPGSESDQGELDRKTSEETVLTCPHCGEKFKR